MYATLYPRNTDRVVLDSNDDPDPQRVARGWAANYAVGVVDRFPDFAAWAANHAAEYDLGASAARVRDTFQRLVTRLDTDPLPALDGNALRQTMLGALYSDANFPALASLMHAVIAGEPLPLPSNPPQAVLQNVAAVVVGTICNDVGWPRDVSSYARAVAANRLAYPLTNGMPVNIFACAFRPGPTEPPVRVTARQTDGVLLVQKPARSGDPLQWSVEAAGGAGGPGEDGHRQLRRPRQLPGQRQRLGGCGGDGVPCARRPPPLTTSIVDSPMWCCGSDMPSRRQRGVHGGSHVDRARVPLSAWRSSAREGSAGTR